MRARTVLIADHEPEVGEMSRRYLARAGLVPAVVTTPGEALAALAAREADLFVLDLTMPGLAVAAVSRALAAGDRLPVVFLLDRFGIRPRGLSGGLSAGLPATRAWLSRPFSPRALVDAATALLRPGPARAPAARAGERGIRVTVAGREVVLTRTERAILAALAGQPGRVLSRAELLAALEADRGKRPASRAIDVYVTQLRAKLGTGAIRTVHGLGYALNPESSPELGRYWACSAGPRAAAGRGGSGARAAGACPRGGGSVPPRQAMQMYCGGKLAGASDGGPWRCG